MKPNLSNNSSVWNINRIFWKGLLNRLLSACVPK